MNKKLIAIAVASVISAPMVAQADVEVYGKFKMGVASVSDGSGNSGMAVTSDASRLGVKGSEDLGDGMQAIYQLETEVKADTSNAADFGRNTFVGLKDSWGSVRLGKFDTAYKTTTSKMDPFGDTAGDMTGSGFFSSYDLRVDNTVSYTNKFGDLKLGLDAHMPELTGGSMGTSIGADYKMGNFNIIVANTTLTNGDGATKLGVAMKFGDTRVNLINETQSDADNASILGVNASMKMGKGDLAVAYNSNAVSSDSQISLGYFNKMAKSTKIGVVYSSITGSSKGRLDKGVAGTFTANNPNAIQFILHHNF